jgi:hypothetical protein
LAFEQTPGTNAIFGGAPSSARTIDASVSLGTAIFSTTAGPGGSGGATGTSTTGGGAAVTAGTVRTGADARGGGS